MAAAKALFSIIAITVLPAPIEKQEYSYSVDIQMNTTCPAAKIKSEIVLNFRSTDEGKKTCKFAFNNTITCTNFTYGVNYSITGYVQCRKKDATLSGTKNLYMAKPGYINSTSTPTSIDTLFFFPGLFTWFYVEIKSVNQNCHIARSPTTSPFYNCSFRNLPSAESFSLTYFQDTESNKRIYGDPEMIYTELEDLNFSCQLNETNQQIAFYWSNLTSPGYNNSNLTISLGIAKDKSSWYTSCNPYRSQGTCSMATDKLEPDTEYRIITKLKKDFPDYTAERKGNCSIKINPSSISVNNIRHEFLNATTVRLYWSKRHSRVQVQLRNFETNFPESPIKSNETSALFVNLAAASIYQVELNISKPKPAIINQTTHYFIETELEDLNFLCQLNETNGQIAFYWSNLTSPGYNNSNLTISLAIAKDKSSWNTSCDPYRPKGNCSTKSHPIEPGTEYQITAYLEKVFENNTRQKNKSCSIKTNLSRIPKNSTQSELFNKTSVRVKWLKHPFAVDVRLRNLETNFSHNPSVANETNALFIDLVHASIYQIEFNISKENYSSILQTMDYFIQTELEDLNFTCQLNETNGQIAFYWSNFTSPGYNTSNLTISLSIEKNKTSLSIPCNPYRSQGNCSIERHKLEPGTEYHIIAKLKKVHKNFSGQKNGTCSIKTSLSPIPMNATRYRIVDETTVRIIWSKHRFSVQARLRNLETNSLTYPAQEDETSALFTDLAEASIYQVELNISKENYPSINQTTNCSIQTNLTKLILGNVVRLSEKSLLVNINRDNSSRIPITYCISKIFENNSPICSTSNRFDQLSPATIYNVSVSIYRDSFENRFFWKNQTVSKLVNTNLTPLEPLLWKNESCGVKLLNQFPLNYSTECINNGTKFNCTDLRCGCEYQLNITFDQIIIKDLCSSSTCDLQLNNSNFTVTTIRTPLESVKNLRRMNNSLVSKDIQVEFDEPIGCFDQLILVCESKLTKEKTLSNSTNCTGLISNEFYRIYVLTNRKGWEPMHSEILDNQQLTFTAPPTEENNKLSTVIYCIIGILVLSGSAAFLFIYRQRRQIFRSRSPITINNQITTNKLNSIVNHVTIYPNSKKNHPTISKRIVLLSRPIRIQDLVDEYEQLIADDCYRASDEFEKLQNSLPEIPRFIQVNQAAKNRYKDIIPYEHSRVRLISYDEFDPGYINANFISGLNHSQEYIACQGPIKTTIDDHWRMIWEQYVTTIVMLTALVERGTTKCEQYWPMEVEQAQMYGEISVCVTECVTLPTYDLRHIQLKKYGEVRSIKHYALRVWADHTVPTDGGELVNLIRLIRSEYCPEDGGPMLVHCSAGVGRTGTFIALDRLIQQFDKLSFDDCLDVYGTVLDMRRCRDKMVQNETQYLFLYRCLKEEYEKTSGESNYSVIADDPV